MNNVIEIRWLDRKFHGINKTKWDGMLFKTGHRNIPPGFLEFSGGANGASASDKERCDIH